MEMNSSFSLKTADREPKWRLIDATNIPLGRLSTKVADILRGKDKPTFTPHIDSGDYVVIINCDLNLIPPRQVYHSKACIINCLNSVQT